MKITLTARKFAEGKSVEEIRELANAAENQGLEILSAELDAIADEIKASDEVASFGAVSFLRDGTQA